jgi:integrase
VPSLTELAVKNARPPERGTVTLWDTLKGFGLRISSGGTKTWIVLIASGRRQSIGRWPLVSLSEARQEARRILAEKQLGKVRPRFKSFSEAKREYLAECQKKNKASTYREYERLLARVSFNRENLADVTARDILAVLKVFVSESERRHIYTVLRGFFRWCVRSHLLDRSPMENVLAPSNGKSRDRVLSETELQAVYSAARTLKTPFHALVAILIHTGARRGEIASMEWSWLSDDGLTIPASATKNGKALSLPLGPEALALIRSLPRLVDNPYVFPAMRERRKGQAATTMSGWSKAMDSFRRELGDTVAPFTLHDLRRVFASNMQRLGVRLEVTEALLNHISGSQAGVVGIYQRYGWDKEKREALLQWERYLTTLAASGG